MAGAGQRPVLAFEMLAEDQQDALDQALAEATSAADLAARLQWRTRGWPDFAMYYPLFQTARRYRLPVLAADLNAEARRVISHGGLGALPAADPILGASRLPEGSPRESAPLPQIGAGHRGGPPARPQGPLAAAWPPRTRP